MPRCSQRLDSTLRCVLALGAVGCCPRSSQVVLVQVELERLHRKIARPINMAGRQRMREPAAGARQCRDRRSTAMGAFPRQEFEATLVLRGKKCTRGCNRGATCTASSGKNSAAISSLFASTDSHFEQMHAAGAAD